MRLGISYKAPPLHPHDRTGSFYLLKVNSGINRPNKIRWVIYVFYCISFLAHVVVMNVTYCSISQLLIVFNHNMLL